MSEDDYYHGVDVGIDIYMDRAMYAEARSRVWKRAAKNKLEEVQILQRAEKDYEEQLRKCYATATRLRELLRGLEWSWNNNGLERCPECGGFKEKYERLGKLYKKDIIGHADDCELALEIKEVDGE